MDRHFYRFYAYSTGIGIISATKSMKTRQESSEKEFWTKEFDMKVSYYPGCSLKGTAKSFNTSVLRVCETLRIDIEEPPDWTCCGSSPALKMDSLLSVSLSAHNLLQIEKQKASDVLIPCPFCFRRLKSAQDDLNTNESIRLQVENVLNKTIPDKITIHNPLGYFHQTIGLDAIRGQVRKPLTGLKILPYYGCYLVKPSTVTQFDDPENPTSMDKLLQTLGAEVLDWDFKTECCGAGLSLAKTEKVEELSRRIVEEAKWRGADAIAAACQLCQSNLDIRQKPSSLFSRVKDQMPIVYFTQLMGLSFGHAPESLGLHQHVVSTVPMLHKMQ